MISLLSASPAQSQTPPPSAGDWIILDNTSLSSQIVIVNGSVLVEPGGSLLLTDSELWIQSDFPGEHGIRVSAGATLLVANATIGAGDLSKSFWFESYGNTNLNNSTVQDLWGSPLADAFGIQILGGNASITNSTIQRGHKGNILVAGGTVVIAGNEVRGAVFEQSEVTAVDNCTYSMKFTAYGILVVNGSAPLIESNRIVDNGNRSSFVDPWPSTFGANAGACNGSRFNLGEFLLGYGIAVRGANATILDNDFSSNSAFGLSSDTYVVNGTTVYVYRDSLDEWTSSWGAAIALAEQAGGMVSRNRLLGNNAMGIDGSDTLASIEGNDIRGSRFAAFGVGDGVLARNSTLADNRVAIWFYGLGSAVVGRTGGAYFYNISIAPSAGQNDVGVQVSGFVSAGQLKIENGDFSGLFIPMLVSNALFASGNGATVHFLNCSIDPYKVKWQRTAIGAIVVDWLLQIEVRWFQGNPVPYATTVVTDLTGGTVAADTVNQVGVSRPLRITGFAQSWVASGGYTVWNLNLTISAWANGTSATSILVAFNRSLTVIVDLVDDVAPVLVITDPAAGTAFDISTISIRGFAFDLQSGLERVEVSMDGQPPALAAFGQGPAWSTFFEIPDGTHSVRVCAFDKGGLVSEFVVDGILVDTLAPIIAVSAPNISNVQPDGTVLIASPGVLLRGTVEDGASFTVNGVPVLVQGGTFSFALTLVEGANAIRLAATDQAGNQDELGFLIVLDTFAPPLFVTDPLEGYQTSRSDLMVGGVTEVDARVWVNGVEAANIGGVFAHGATLALGTNNITIEVRDRAGNGATLTRQVLFDNEPPSLRLDSPIDATVTVQRSVLVVGETDVSVQFVYVNGARLATVNGLFNGTLALSENANRIEVEAIDGAGNRAFAYASVVLDTTPPSVEIDSPTNGAVTNRSMVRVGGSASEHGELLLNGIAVQMVFGAFAANVSLREGTNELLLRAVDLAGNVAETRLTVSLDTVPPVVELGNLPSLIDLSGFVTISGRAAGAFALRINGFVAALDAFGNFSIGLPMNTGSNHLFIDAVDAAGNHGLVERELVLENAVTATNGLGSAAATLSLLAAASFALGVIATSAVMRWRARAGSEKDRK